MNEGQMTAPAVMWVWRVRIAPATLFLREHRGPAVAVKRKIAWLSPRTLGITMVILSVIHVPIPQVDYHNIRHHDAPGENCALHDHLLRWHPLARFDDDVTLLHWHWFLPLVQPGAHDQLPDDDHPRPGSGPAFHAHIGDGLEAENWQGQPGMTPDSRGRFLGRLSLSVSGPSPAPLCCSLVDPVPSRFSGCTITAADGVRRAHHTFPALELLIPASGYRGGRLARTRAACQGRAPEPSMV